MSLSMELTFCRVKTDMGKGPFSAQILADYGANVIKIEQPGKGVSFLAETDFFLVAETLPGRHKALQIQG
jgi:hypothetical protein